MKRIFILLARQLIVMPTEKKHSSKVSSKAEGMENANYILHFGGVHSAMYLWINGKKVSYSQNSMSPAYISQGYHHDEAMQH